MLAQYGLDGADVAPITVIRRGNLTLRIKGFQAVSTQIGVESARRMLFGAQI